MPETSCIRRAPVLLLMLLGAAVAPAPAGAALPASGSRFEAHDHETKGANWHIEAEVGKDRRKLESVVLYAERCKATLLDNDVEISDAGDVAASGTFESGGAWQLTARFESSRSLTGTFQITKGACDSGPLAFKAQRGGDGHDHGKGHHHHSGRKYPALRKATRAQRAQAEGLRREAHRMARTRFRTYRAARALGYVRRKDRVKRPLPFHLRYAPYERDGTTFSPARVESLVYWWPRKGAPILIGYMFRVPAPGRPAFAGPIPIYHRHAGADGKLGSSQMTHVWLTGDLRSAWANCLPVAQLEKANPRFRYSRPGNGVSGGETKPCEPPGRK